MEGGGGADGDMKDRDRLTERPTKRLRKGKTRVGKKFGGWLGA